MSGSVRAPIADGGIPSADQPQTENEMADVMPGWVRIKLEENAEPLRTGAFTRGEVYSGNQALDDIAANYGVTEIRRTIRRRW